MDSHAAAASSNSKYGETPAFRVSAQTPSRPDPRKSATMFNPVMRMPPVFQPYHSTPTGSPEPRQQTSAQSVPAKRSSPAPITFIQQKPALRPLDQPTKRRRVEEKVPKYKFTNKKTPFSIHRPLRNSDDVHKDIWTHILSFCPPRFMLQAKTINSLFYEILSQQAIWRESRYRHLGDAIPKCPSGINEQQYTDLLVGKGCQSASCRRQNTNSANWALLVRLCPDCLMSKTTRLQDLPVSRVHRVSGIHNLCDALPMLSIAASHRSEPREIRVTDEEVSYAESGRSASFRFVRSDYDQLEAEFLDLRDGGATDEAINSWWQSKYDITMGQMKERIELNRWNNSNHYSSSAAETRSDRETFFISKASELDPPIEKSTLECFTAYKKALSTQNPPTERSWETLKVKLLPLRENAEELERAIKRVERSTSGDVWETLSDHRIGCTRYPPALKPEQEFVVQLGRREFERCKEKGVSDADLVLLTLKNTYERFYSAEKRPQGLNYNGRRGPYQLSLDDARLIIDLVIKREIPAGSQLSVRVYNRFKCPACVREKERGRLFSFASCFEHLLNHHGRTVGEGPEFWRYALAERPQRGVYWYRQLPFPWYTVRWPRCLPVLPEHQDPAALEPWDPGSTRPYIQEVVNTTSAFQGREVNAEVEASGFLELFVHAANALSGIRLEGQALTRIALQFAVDVSEQRGYVKPALSQFLDVVPSIQGSNPAMDFRFRCGTCMANGDQKASSRHIKHNIPIDNLYLHWRKSHDDESPTSSRRRGSEDSQTAPRDWTRDFMHLPSDTELHEQIVDSDAVLAKEKEEIHAAATASNARRKPKAKATVILATRPALAAFDELFPMRVG
ncbi:uncharacterized protein HMPREF1541_06797 [Cyphellophora europaea CBS 101466]|uniref:DUF7892 domain-containing protein n=1 Tax=Cyphellophora europaea (strain CBS 101466) TaxID=1220924 RepID=W2RSQ8_CYPE1|nr:uncharacterized protein HMPREF1541_06797 [Cyphellophora europaea CBS 101466]ETN38759.1 hypothetical protein HMPREF1541_06797 [Cyphellophora europaea CBS 101466]